MASAMSMEEPPLLKTLRIKHNSTDIDNIQNMIGRQILGGVNL
jgi:hypothetical protein